MARKVIRGSGNGSTKLRHFDVPLVENGVAELIAPFVAAGDPHKFYGSVFKLTPPLVTPHGDGGSETHHFIVEMVNDVQWGPDTRALLMLAHHASEFADAPLVDSEAVRVAKAHGVYFDGHIPCPVFSAELEVLVQVATATVAAHEALLGNEPSGLTFDSAVRAVTLGVLDLLGYTQRV